MLTRYCRTCKKPTYADPCNVPGHTAEQLEMKHRCVECNVILADETEATAIAHMKTCPTKAVHHYFPDIYGPHEDFLKPK